jgi:transposase
MRKEPIMSEGTTFVGMDVHKEKIQVAVYPPGTMEPTESVVLNKPRDVRRLAQRVLKEAPGYVHACYEAGPCGFVVQRMFQEEGVLCDVIAPSLVPRKPGERIKTDRRDARKLGRLLRAGELTAVMAPTKGEEAVRDLCRGREDVMEDLTRARHRMAKLLLRLGIEWNGGKKAWGKMHRRWLEGLRFDFPAQQFVFDDYLLAITRLEERIKTFDAEIERVAGTEPYREVVGHLRTFRGIETWTAMVLVSELFQFGRFAQPRQLMAYLGIVPSEASSGNRRRQGSITKTGNGHVRRILVEVAHHYRNGPRASRKMNARRHGQPKWVLAIAERAEERLHRRFWALLSRRKPPCKIVVAIARELVGFLWSILVRSRVADA